MKNAKFALIVLTALMAVWLPCMATATVYYVKTTGDNGNTGLSWAQARQTIGSAMGLTSYGDQIWVAAGTYLERIDLNSGVRLYGGFAGTETSVDQRDWNTNVTSIDGNSGGSVVKINTAINSFTRVDGFNIFNGTGTSHNDCSCGGAIFINEGASPTIANNKIHDSRADMGGGIYCGDLAAPVITNNIIYNNEYKYFGGGMRSTNASPIITNNIFHSNTGWHYLSSGGGLALTGDDGYPVLSNNTIVDNSAQDTGGAILVMDVHITLNNNIIAYNNTGVYNYSGGSFTWSHNCIYSNAVSGTTNPVGSDGNISADPDFVARGSNDYHLLNGSPCIDTGDDTAVGTGWVDIDGQDRIAATHVDIGADETYYCATPTFDPYGGTYDQPQSVTISTTTTGAVIHYTTDGSEPTEASPIASGPVSVDVSLTLKAIATKDNWVASNVASATYVLKPAMPTFDPIGGTYDQPQSVTISCTSPGVTIYYTIDGNDPTESSTVVSGPVSIDESLTLKARAYRTGWSASNIKSSNYYLKAATPEFSPGGGTYNEPQDVTITCASPGVTIHYTTNGSTPTESDPVVSGPVTVDGLTTLKAVAFRTNWTESDTNSEIYTIRIATPEFNPPGGAYYEPQSVEITCSTPYVTIRYTTDGSDPTETSTIFSQNVPIDATTNLKAKAWRQDWIESEVGSALYTMSLPAPVIDPSSGMYSSQQEVEISCGVTGAEIHYTTDGNDPTQTDPLYTVPFTVSVDTTVKAKAWRTDWNPSSISQADYVFQAADPVLYPVPSTHHEPIYVTITCESAGASIRFTTNGSEPTESSQLYTAPIYVDSTTTIKAKAWVSGWSASQTVTGVYTQEVHAPTLDPGSGTHTSAFDVTVTCDTTGATIRYTTDGSTPTESSDIYTSPVNVDHSLTFKAKAWKTGWEPSVTRTAIYSFPIHVKPTGNDSYDGSRWVYAKRTITGALGVAASGNEIWVAAGTYSENITLVSGVALYGGFNGTELTRNARDWVTNQTIIDCAQSGTVVTVPASAGNSTRIDGFTIRDGISSAGAGIYCDSNSLVRIANNIITSNSAKSTGASAYGGGIYCYNATPHIYNNVINANNVRATTNNFGAGICCVGGAPRIYCNTIVGNNASLNGTDYGGGICCQNSSPILYSNIIAFNTSGLYFTGSGSPTISDNDFYGNTSYNTAGVSLNRTNISEDPLFVDYIGGDYHLSDQSGCIDEGADILVPDNDIDGLLRPMDGNNDGSALADMGAYEYPFDLVWARNIFADGENIAFGDVGVTLNYPTRGFLYVEKPDRTCGIRVAVTDDSILSGACVNVSGVIRTDSITGERYIDPDEGYPVQSGKMTISSLGMTDKSLGGGTCGLQVGVSGGAGLNNFGILVKVWGKVLSTDTDSFVIDDGSGASVKCFAPSEYGITTMPTVDQYVSVRGVSSCEMSAGERTRLVLIRYKNDLVVFDSGS